MIHNKSSTSGFLGVTRSLKAREASSVLGHGEPRCSFRSLHPGKVLPGAPVTPRNSGTTQRSEQTRSHDRLYLQHEYPIQFVYRNSLPSYIYNSTPRPVTMSRSPQPSKRSASAAGVLGDITGNERRVRHSAGKGEVQARDENGSGPFSPEGNVPRRPSRRRSFSSPVVESAPFPSLEEMMGTQDAEDPFRDEWDIPDENIAPGSEESPLEISPGPEMPVPPPPSRQRSASPADIESAPFPSVEELRGTAVTPEIFIDERDRPASKSPRFDVSGFGAGLPPRSPSPIPAAGRLYAEERPAISFPKMGIFGKKQPVVPETAASVDEDGTISPTDMERMDGLENMDWATEFLDADFSSPTFQSMGPEDLPTGVTQADTIPGVSDSRPGSAPPFGVG